MFRFLLRRFLFIAGTIIAIIFFVFFGLHLAEGSGLSPVECALGAFHSSLRYLQGKVGAVVVGWAPGEEEPPVDNVIDLNRLEKAGQVVNLALIRAAKEELALSAE